VVLHLGEAVEDTGRGFSEGCDDGRLGWVTWTFTVPKDQPLGRAFLKTEASEPLPVRVRR